MAKRSKLLQTPSVENVLTICAMLGECKCNIWEAIPNESRTNVTKHLRDMCTDRVWRSDESPYRTSEIKLLIKHGSDRSAMYALTNEAISEGVLDELDLYEYWELYAKCTQKSYQGYRDRNRKLSGVMMGLHHANVHSLCTEKPVPGIDLKGRPFDGKNSYFYTLKEIRKSMSAGSMENIAYGEALGLAILKAGPYAIYGLELTDSYHQRAPQERMGRLFQRFLRTYTNGGYTTKLNGAIWSGAGYAPVKARIREHDRGKNKFIYGSVYDCDYYIPDGMYEKIIPLIGMMPKGVKKLDGEPAKWADWIRGKEWMFNGITCDLAKLLEFRRRSMTIRSEKYSVLCLREQEEFYKEIFGKNVRLYYAN